MKRDGRVRQQYKQVKYRARKKLLDKSLRVEPCNCCFHTPVSPDRSSRVALCDYAEMAEDSDWDVVLCDLIQAKQCENFIPAATPEEVKRRFDRFLAYAEQSGGAQAMGALAYHYPEMDAVLWVLEPWVDGLVPCTVCGGQCNPQSPCESCVAEGGCSCGATLVDIEDSRADSAPDLDDPLVAATQTESKLPLKEATEETPPAEESESEDSDEDDDEEFYSEQKVPPDQVLDDDAEDHPVVSSAETLRRVDTPFFPWITPHRLSVAAGAAFVVLTLFLLWLEYR